MILHGLRRSLIEGAPVGARGDLRGHRGRHRRRRRARRRRPDPPRPGGARGDRAVRRLRRPARRDRRGLSVPLAVAAAAGSRPASSCGSRSRRRPPGRPSWCASRPGPRRSSRTPTSAAGAAATLATMPPADGSYRYRLRAARARRRAPCRCASGRCGSPPSATSRPAPPWPTVRAHGPAWHWSKVGAWLRGARRRGGEPRDGGRHRRQAVAGQELPLPVAAGDHPGDGAVGRRRRRHGRQQPRRRLRPPTFVSGLRTIRAPACSRPAAARL